MQDITISAQQACDAAKAVLAKLVKPNFAQTAAKTACDTACEGLDPCELPEAPTDTAESGFEQDRTHFDD